MRAARRRTVYDIFDRPEMQLFCNAIIAVSALILHSDLSSDVYYFKHVIGTAGRPSFPAVYRTSVRTATDAAVVISGR